MSEVVCIIFLILKYLLVGFLGGGGGGGGDEGRIIDAVLRRRGSTLLSLLQQTGKLTSTFFTKVHKAFTLLFSH